MRGYCGIGIIGAKKEVNLGTLWRSAYCLGASFIFTIGARYQKQASDTVAAWRHIPYWRFDSWEEFVVQTPYDCQKVAVEIVPLALALPEFKHPQRAMYILGPEDGTLPKYVLDDCQHVVQIESRYCLNVAVAGSIVLYDRLAKVVETARMI